MKPFQPKKGKMKIKGRIVRDIQTLFEHEDSYYKLLRVGHFFSKNYIKYKSNGDRSKYLSIKKYLDEIQKS